jgi:hypothetical protein
MAITKRSILFRLERTSSHHIATETTVEQKHRGIMDIYEVELCRRGRWEQQDARFVAAGDADEAAYKVTGEHLHSEGERRKVRLRVRRLGNGSPPPKLFYAL